jgi:hypothetical protein
MVNGKWLIENEKLLMVSGCKWLMVIGYWLLANGKWLKENGK